jgi:glutamate--cysteine ligase catalytic subunit
MEIQLTDFENAALSILIVLFTRAILAMGYNLYLPISYVEENMRRAQLKDAVTDQTFYFRRQSFNAPSTSDDSGRHSQRLVPELSDVDIVEVTLNEIFNGSAEQNIRGIIPSVIQYLHSLGTCEFTLTGIYKYLTFLSKRASGELPTAASWMRNFVKSHPKYTGNGEVSYEVASDLLKLCNDIGMGRVRCPELHGDYEIDRLCVEDVKETYLESSVEDISGNASIVVDRSGENNSVDEGCNDGVKEDLMKIPAISDAYLG